MAADGHLNFDTNIDEKGFNSGVKKLGSVAKTGLSLLTTSVASVSAVMGAGVVAGVKYNASMETYFSNFETMLGSAELATQHVADLKKFAAETPFEMTDLASASKTLLAFGTNVNDVMPDLKMLGDISLGDKDKFNSLALVFGQISSQGKMMGQDLLQCINAGFNPLQVISEHTGESMASLKDKMSKGQIGIEDVTQAMKWATEEGGQFCGGMEKASKTFNGLVSTLKDNAMSLLGEVVEPITSGMTESLLPAALNAIDQVSNAFRTDGVDGLVSALGDVLAQGISATVGFAPKVVELAVSIINSFVNGLTDNASTITTGVIAIFDTLLNGFIDIIPSIAELGWSIVSSLAQGIVDALPDLLDNLISNATDFLVQLYDFAPQLYQFGSDILIQLVNGILSAVPTLIASIPTIIDAYVNAMLQCIPIIIQTGIQLLTSLVTALPQIIQSIVAVIPEIITSIINALFENIPLIIQAGFDLITALVTDLPQIIITILQAIPQIISGILGTLADHIPDIISMGFDLLVSLVENLPGIIGQIICAVPEIVDALVESFIDSVGSMVDVGARLVEGIWDGISGAAGWLWNKVSGWAGGLVDDIKGVFGIHSPSRVMRDQVGKYLALGVGVGMDENMPVDDMDKSVTKAVDSLQAHVNGLTCNVPVSSTTDYYSNVATNNELTVDYDKLADAMDKRPVQINGDIHTTVEMDKQVVGDAVTPIVSENLTNDARRKR